MIVMATVIVTGGCSSAPRVPEQEVGTKNQAAQYVAAGNAAYSQGRYFTAAELFELALTLNISVDNEPGIVGANVSLAKTYIALGNLTRAENHGQRALSLAERLEAPALIGQSINVLGEIALVAERSALAAQLFRDGLLRLGNADDRLEAVLHHNLGAALKAEGQFEQALAEIELALSLNLRLKQLTEAASNHYLAASIHSKSGNYEPALAHATSALELDRQMEHSVGIAQDHRALAVIVGRMGDHDTALQHYASAYRVYESIGLRDAARGLLPAMIESAGLLGRTAEVDRLTALLGSDG